MKNCIQRGHGSFDSSTEDEALSCGGVLPCWTVRSTRASTSGCTRKRMSIIENIADFESEVSWVFFGNMLRFIRDLKCFSRLPKLSHLNTTNSHKLMLHPSHFLFGLQNSP